MSTCYCRSGGRCVVCVSMCLPVCVLVVCVCVCVCVCECVRESVECIQVLSSFVNDCYFFISTK